MLSDDAIHRALLWMEDGHLWIRDLEGEARMLLGSRQLLDPTVIGLQDRIRFGPGVELQVRHHRPEDGRFPYRMEVALHGTLGPEAYIEDLNIGNRCTLLSANRVSMLYLLGRQLQTDADSIIPAEDRGWCSDEIIACGVWGKRWKEQFHGHFYVLLHRIRKKLKAAGLDPMCIEKKRRHSRAWIQEAVLA